LRLPGPWAGNAARLQFIFSKLNILNGLSTSLAPAASRWSHSGDQERKFNASQLNRGPNEARSLADNV
jgi:hypothetical protein